MIGRTPRPGNIGEDALNNTKLLPETRERNVSTPPISCWRYRSVWEWFRTAPDTGLVDQIPRVLT